MEFEWNVSQDSQHWGLSVKSGGVRERDVRTRTIPRTNYLHVDVQ